jgi:hypothetical protein
MKWIVGVMEFWINGMTFFSTVTERLMAGGFFACLF